MSPTLADGFFTTSTTWEALGFKRRMFFIQAGLRGVELGPPGGAWWCKRWHWYPGIRLCTAQWWKHQCSLPGAVGNLVLGLVWATLKYQVETERMEDRASAFQRHPLAPCVRLYNVWDNVFQGKTKRTRWRDGVRGKQHWRGGRKYSCFLCWTAWAVSGHINHVGNFWKKIKFCYNVHLCLLEETVRGSIDHAASFLPRRCKFTSGGCQGD